MRPGVTVVAPPPAPDQEVASKATRRRFTAAHKLSIVEKADACQTSGRSERCSAPWPSPRNELGFQHRPDLPQALPVAQRHLLARLAERSAPGLLGSDSRTQRATPSNERLAKPRKPSSAGRDRSVAGLTRPNASRTSSAPCRGRPGGSAVGHSSAHDTPMGHSLWVEVRSGFGFLDILRPSCLAIKYWTCELLLTTLHSI